MLILSIICAIQTILLLVIFTWAKKSQYFEFIFHRTPIMGWNIFWKGSNFAITPGSWATLGSFVWNETKTIDDFKAIQPIESVTFQWLCFAITMNIKYNKYLNDSKKKIQLDAIPTLIQKQLINN